MKSRTKLPLNSDGTNPDVWEHWSKSRSDLRTIAGQNPRFAGEAPRVAQAYLDQDEADDRRRQQARNRTLMWLAIGVACVGGLATVLGYLKF